MLNKDNFTEGQWAEIQADIDRERTRASETARKNTQKAADAVLDQRIQEAIAEERAKLEMDEQQKLEAERKKIEDARTALAIDQKTLTVTKKLVSGGFDEEIVETLIPMFVNLEASAIDSTIDAFIDMNKAMVKTQVDAEKAALLNHATPPSTPPGGPIDPAGEVAKALAAGNEVMAIDMLLGDAASVSD